LIVSEFGVCPPRASTSGAGPPYALIHASRNDMPGAPDSPPQVRARAWIPSVQASRECDGPGIWSMPPYTAWAAPPRQRRASDDANARAKAFSAAIRDRTGSAVGDADGAPGWGRFQSTRFTDANGSSTIEQKNREACARVLSKRMSSRGSSHAEAKAAAERAAAERAAAAVALRRGMEAVRVAV